MQDILNELLGVAKEKGVKWTKYEARKVGGDGSKWEELVEGVKRKLKIMKQNNADLGDMKESYSKATTSQEEKEVRERVNQLV